MKAMLSAAVVAALSVGLFTGPTLARSVFDDLRDSAPRSVFDDLRDSAPRTVFDDLRDSAPRTVSDDLREPVSP
jgi:hypothetical protein